MANQPAAWRQAVTWRLSRDLVSRAQAAAASNDEPVIALVTRALEREVDADETVARLESVAAGRREYAERAPEDQRAVLLAEAAAFESAARIAAGDLSRLHGLLPSWRWPTVAR